MKQHCGGRTMATVGYTEKLNGNKRQTNKRWCRRRYTKLRTAIWHLLRYRAQNPIRNEMYEADCVYSRQPARLDYTVHTAEWLASSIHRFRRPRVNMCRVCFYVAVAALLFNYFSRHDRFLILFFDSKMLIANWPVFRPYKNVNVWQLSGRCRQRNRRNRLICALISIYTFRHTDCGHFSKVSMHVQLEMIK